MQDPPAREAARPSRARERDFGAGEIALDVCNSPALGASIVRCAPALCVEETHLLNVSGECHTAEVSSRS